MSGLSLGVSNQYEIVEKAPRHRGRLELLDYLDGKKVSPLRSIAAKCYECMGYYSDGSRDCEMPDCPLYAYMPYGKVKRKTKVMSPVTLEALKRGREKSSAKKERKRNAK